MLVTYSYNHAQRTNNHCSFLLLLLLSQTRCLIVCVDFRCECVRVVVVLFFRFFSSLSTKNNGRTKVRVRYIAAVVALTNAGDECLSANIDSLPHTHTSGVKVHRAEFTGAHVSHDKRCACNRLECMDSAMIE